MLYNYICTRTCMHVWVCLYVTKSWGVQGTSIPALIQVDLELQGTAVVFSPPLTSSVASQSIPEAVQMWLSHYMDLAKLVRRVTHDTEVLMVTHHTITHHTITPHTITPSPG